MRANRLGLIRFLTLAGCCSLVIGCVGKPSDPEPTTTPTVDTTAPSITQTTPSASATEVVQSIKPSIVFDEAVVAGSGSITFKCGDCAREESLDVTGASVTISDKTVTLTLTQQFENNRTYTWTIPAGAFKDAAGNATVAKTLTFTTAATPPYIRRLSVSGAGAQANGVSANPAASADGRYVVYESDASNLVANDKNGKRDIFYLDVQTLEVRRISVSSAGVEANGASYSPAISPDGRYVVYESDATNLVGDDKNKVRDIFLYDAKNASTVRVSLNSSGVEGNAESNAGVVSQDGRYIAFSSKSTNLVAGATLPSGTLVYRNIYLHDMLNGKTTVITQGGGVPVLPVDDPTTPSVDESIITTPLVAWGNADSNKPTLSNDGRYIAYQSLATNLGPTDTNGKQDIYLYDVNTGTGIPMLVTGGANDDSLNPRLTRYTGGVWLAYQSYANNLDNLADINNEQDVYIYDSAIGANRLASLNSGGAGLNGSSLNPSVASSGQDLVFESWASNLVNGDTNLARDVFWRNLGTGVVKRLSVTKTGKEVARSSWQPYMALNGRYVLFESDATDLVDDDTNAIADIFMVDMNYLP
ncbi:MAG: Ig-like domain-containing protein [Pseudomonadota bacterium]